LRAAKAAGVDDADYCATVAEVVSSQMNARSQVDINEIQTAVETAIRGLTAVSDMSHIRSVPSIAAGNAASHAIGLGQMNLHGY
ncbi:hypothetical protein ONO12_28320, partial [Salmonella enterica subsp. enterica serovar Montevideo]|nr:hypothetical protein [Salmonella enterica subsp. enterica serovar Montevideo]